MFTAERIQKQYGHVVALSAFSVELWPGTVTVLMGPSGGGKSTALRALSLLEPPDSGSITIDTETFRFPDARVPATVWPRVTVVFQQLFLWPHLSIWENITLPIQDGLTAAKTARLEAFAHRLGIAHVLKSWPNQVSGGQRQRAALIRALMLEPKYLLLDEITAALDVEHVRIVGELLREERDQGMAILVATHLGGFAKAVADRVVFLDGGAVLEQGNREVLTSPQHPRVRRFLAML
ncbi:MAG: ATP-binding cassette domain-containing protein [Byssovorax sp.]